MYNFDILTCALRREIKSQTIGLKVLHSLLKFKRKKDSILPLLKIPTLAYLICEYTAEVNPEDYKILGHNIIIGNSINSYVLLTPNEDIPRGSASLHYTKDLLKGMSEVCFRYVSSF